MLDTSWECHKVREFALRPMGDFLLVLDLRTHGATPVKKYHSAIPHKNSVSKNFIHTCLMLNSENISYILGKILHLLQSITIIRHVSAQITMPKQTISHRRLLFVHYPLLKYGPFKSVKSTHRYIAKWNTRKSRWSTPLSSGTFG